MFKKTLILTRAQDVKIRKHEVRISVSYNGRFGMYDPHVTLFLRGPNGSVSGHGPKPWPWKIGTGNAVRIPLPHVKWATGYRLRKIGGIAVYKTISRAYRGILDRGEVAA